MCMTMVEFKKELRNNIEAKADVELKEEHISKSNGIEYDGLVVKGRTVAAVINVDMFYDDYTSGTDFEVCVDKAVEIINRPVPKFSGLDLSTPNVITKFANVMGIIYPRLVPRTERYLDLPHTEVADLLVIYAVRISATSDGLAEAVVNEDLLNMWGISLENLHRVAMCNLEEDEVSTLDMMVFVAVTNKYKCKGAVECLNPKVMEKFKDYYIIPSSTEEILFIPKDAHDDVNMLFDMVRDVNSGMKTEEVLSGNIYQYNNGTIEVVEV